MRGLCKTKCENQIVYESHEFSDGFVYYLPRNLDGTIHNCPIMQIVIDVDYRGVSDSWEDYFSKYKNYIKLDSIPKLEEAYRELDSQFMFSDIQSQIPIGLNLMNEFFDDYRDASSDIACNIINGNQPSVILKGHSDYLLKHLQNLTKILPCPFFPLDPRNKNNESETFDKIGTREFLITPTDNSYQLELLGKIYEIIIKFEDAKKCYELQYECTKEPELLDVIKELDEKIKKRNETKISTKNIPDNITSELMKNSADETEEKLGQYVVALFSNDMNKIWKRLPGIYRQIQEIRKKEQESIIPIEDKTDVERLSLGMLNTILRESMSKKKSNLDGKCEKCGKMWKAYDYVFLANKSKEKEFLICSNEVCFKDQGGLVSDASLSLLNYIYIIKDARNANSHKRNYDQVMLQNVFRTAMNACTTVNDVIEDYLDKKNLV